MKITKYFSFIILFVINIGIFAPNTLAGTINLSDIANGNGSQGLFVGNWHVTKAGDINGDGKNDLIIGAPACTSTSDTCVYVIFGPTTNLASTITNAYLNTLNGANGFKITGVAPLDQSYMDAAGDFNGDGVDDIILSDRFAGGAVYVIFGSKNGFQSDIDVNQLTSAAGLKINREVCDGGLGQPVHGLGDINGDSIADIAIQTRCSEYWGQGLYKSKGYVIYGQKNWSESFDLSGLNGVNGFTVIALSQSTDDASQGLRLNTAGDVNGDKINDLIVGNPGGDKNHTYPPTDYPSGQAYVVFGSNSLPSVFYLPDEFGIASGVRGFTIDGNPNLGIATSVSGTGDINDDGLDDVIVSGGHALDYSFVVFGKQNTIPTSINIDSLNGVNGVKIKGASGYNGLSQAGDFNGDSIDDLIVVRNDSGGDGGEAYVIFGSSSGFAEFLDVANLTDSTGLYIQGYTLGSIALVGPLADVNNDTVDDIAVNLSGYAFRAGFVVYGQGTPKTLIDGLINHVTTLNLPKGIDQSLLTKLESAATSVMSIAPPQETAIISRVSNPTNNGLFSAINLLRAFINEVKAHYGKKILSTEGDWLITRAEQIIMKLDDKSSR